MKKESKPRILIFGVKYYPSRGGTSRVVESLMQALQNEFDFTIYCYRNERAAGLIPGVKTIQFSEIPIKGFGVFWYYLRCCWHLYFSGEDYKLVHLHKIDAAWFLPLIQRKYAVVATSHALPHLNDKWSRFGKYYFRRAERVLMRSKAPVTVVASPLVEYYQKHYGRTVNFIPNGVQPAREIDPKVADPLLERYGVEGPYLFFAARRIIPLKGLHTLLEALRRIQFSGTLVVAGDTGQMPAYTAQVRKAAEAVSTRFIGYIDDRNLLNALIARADLFLFPSEREAMSVMLLEVGSVGTPIIASDIPQNTAVFSAKEVLFFTSKDADDLAGKILWALAHPQQMEEKGQFARRHVESTYAMDRVREAYADLYRQHINGQRNATRSVKRVVRS